MPTPTMDPSAPGRPAPAAPTAVLPRHPRSMLVLLAALGLPLAACPDDPPPPSSTATESDSDPTVTSAGTVDDTSGPAYLCDPGEKRCNGQAFIQTCAPTGLEWLQEPCGTNEQCDPCEENETCNEDRCVGVCEMEAELPSSAGCSFIA